LERARGYRCSPLLGVYLLMETIPESLPGLSPDEMFPVLTPEQQARVLAHGRLRNAENGETIVEPSSPGIKFTHSDVGNA